MASITIRNVEESVKQRLRVRAAKHGRSMEEEARRILIAGVTGADGPNMAVAIRSLFEPLGGVELPEFPDEPVGDPITFD